MTQYGCPNCNAIEGFGEYNIVPGMAEIHRFDDEGEPEYGGGTEMDWNEQGPDPEAPATYHCDTCGTDFDVPVEVPETEAS